MSIISLDTEENNEVAALITLCKSDSQINGVKLRDAHYRLGQMLAKRLMGDLHNDVLTLIIMMRAGLCFGMGVADELERLGITVSILFHYNDEQWNREKENCPQVFDNDILLVDAVINTGDGIAQCAEALANKGNIFFASNVLSEKALQRFENKNLYIIRVSKNSFKGSKSPIVKDEKGPDTGDRLFNTK
jgi:uracil phosphoribosyltransferase